MSPYPTDPNLQPRKGEDRGPDPDSQPRKREDRGPDPDPQPRKREDRGPDPVLPRRRVVMRINYVYSHSTYIIRW